MKTNINRSFNEFVEDKGYKLDDFTGLGDNTILSVKKLFEDFDLNQYFEQYKRFLVDGHFEGKGLELHDSKLELSKWLFPAVNDFLSSKFYKDGHYSKDRTDEFLYKIIFPSEKKVRPGTIALLGEGLTYLYQSEYISKGNSSFNEASLTDRFIKFIEKRKETIADEDILRIFERIPDKSLALSIKNNLHKLDSSLKQDFEITPVTEFTLKLNYYIKRDFHENRLSNDANSWFEKFHLNLDSGHSFIKRLKSDDENFDTFLVKNDDVKIYNAEKIHSSDSSELGVFMGLCDYFNDISKDSAGFSNASSVTLRKLNIKSNTLYCILHLEKGLIDNPEVFINEAVRFSLDNDVFDKNFKEKRDFPTDLQRFKYFVIPHILRVQAKELEVLISDSITKNISADELKGDADIHQPRIFKL